MYSKFLKAITILSLASVGCSIAVPTVEQPRTLTKRAAFDFTKMWDTKLPDADTQRQKVIQGYAEMVELARLVYATRGNEAWGKVYSNYFKDQDLDTVKTLYAVLAGVSNDKPEGDADGADIFANVWARNGPIGGSGDCEEDLDKYLAVSGNAVLKGVKKMVMRYCPKAYKYPSIQGKEGCDALGDNVSGLMSTLGGITLHEIMHFESVTDTAQTSHIKDYGADGYGPMKTREMKDKDSLTNADNYRWFAQELWWTMACGKSFGPPTSNKDYVDCADPGCQFSDDLPSSSDSIPDS